MRLRNLFGALALGLGFVLVLLTGLDGSLPAQAAPGILFVALTLRRTHFYSNVVNTQGFANSRAYGGGASVEGGSLVVEESTFRWNGMGATISSLGAGFPSPARPWRP